MEIIKKVYSKDWHCREAGFKNIIEELSKGSAST
jgi:hypothetical protein